MARTRRRAATISPPQGRTELLANLEAARQAPGFLVYRLTPKRLAALEANLNKALRVRWNFQQGDAVTTP
ncbi:MAG TPA: hypothetical protein VN648_35580 [Candidatus Methylomirabilis sp.]|nr:hypothetical protein [Candidatus Methylomirabilis sp.]